MKTLLTLDQLIIFATSPFCEDVLSSFYVWKFQKIYLQVNFLVFHKLYLFYPSSLDFVNKTARSLTDGNEGTVFFLSKIGTNGIRGKYLRAIYLKVRASFDFFFWIFHFLEVQIKPYFKVDIFPL